MGYLDNFFHQVIGEDNLPKLVFLHGLLGAGANWRRITPAFQESHQILLFDQRGHGRSFQPESGYSPESYSDDLEKILDELGWEKIQLVGHSMGGRNAMHFASQNASRVTKLVIEDIGPDGNREGSLRVERLVQSVPTPFDDKETARNFFREKFEDQALGQYLYSNIVQSPNGKFDWRFSKKGVLESLDRGRAKDRWPELESLKMPTLVVRGEFSNDLSRDVFEEMIRRNRNVTGIEIPNAGHWVHFDKPDEFIEALKSFLD
ncbi:MAG: alpha/beta hydrolase [Bdellovibrionales bacterium]|nr:alpha/beta hydrolase [Bdellovibrionales bacterium]